MQTSRPKIELSAEAEKALTPSPPRCDRCLHFHVCAIAKAFIPLIASSFPPIQKENGNIESTSPIDPLRLAEICRLYTPLQGALTA